jgi:hypothetical protein
MLTFCQVKQIVFKYPVTAASTLAFNYTSNRLSLIHLQAEPKAKLCFCTQKKESCRTLLSRNKICFFGVLAKLRKATIRFFTSAPKSLPHVCPSARMEQLGSHLSDFPEILYMSIFRKSVEKN